MPGSEDAGSLAVYTEAGALARAGENEKAIAAYGKFLELSANEPAIPARVRILARYRSAGLLEKEGRNDEALDAYKAVLTMKGDDDYSQKLKAQAREKFVAGNDEEEK